MSGPKFTMAAMNDEERDALRRLLREVRVAHLGTLRDGAPMVSMTLFLPAGDLSVLHVHVSRLAWHTQDMARDPRVALSIAQTDDARADRQVLEQEVLAVEQDARRRVGVDGDHVLARAGAAAGTDGSHGFLRSGR